jgi:hypothetical protein
VNKRNYVVFLLFFIALHLNARAIADSMLLRLELMQGEWKCVGRYCLDPLVNARQTSKESLLVKDSSLTFAILPCAITDSVRLVRMSQFWSFDYTGNAVRIGQVKLEYDTLIVFDFAPQLLLRKFIKSDFDESLFTQLRRGVFCMECLDGAWEPEVDSLQTGSVKMKSKLGFSGATWISVPAEYYSLWCGKTRLPFGKRTRMYKAQLVADFNRGKWLLKIQPVRGRFRTQTFIYTGSM